MSKTGPSFFAELKRRHVYKVGAAYAVGGWLLVQVATQVFPFFGISNAAVKWSVLVVIAGFPVALVLAWLFDVTPQGIVRTEALPAEGETPKDARDRRGMDRKLNYLLGALLLLGIGYFVAERTVLRGAFAPAAEPAAANDKSVAVLPFENLSEEKANAFFAVGIQDEILTRLAKLHALKVISRTSTQGFASRPENLAEIVTRLGVAAILEGSVQRAGEKVHVNVQLIRAATDEHLWAESYDRSLSDIFAVQGEIAQAVADALKATLSGAEQRQLVERPTSNPQAYEAYLRALVYDSRYTESAADLKDWVAAYQEVVKLDPSFAAAWAGLSRAETEAYFDIDTRPERLQAAKAALDQAQRLAPEAAETLEALGLYRYWGLNDYDAAFEAFSEALKRKPNDAHALYSMGNVRRRQGRWEEGLAWQERAAVFDPLNSGLNYNLALSYRALRRFDDAQRAIAAGLGVDPKSRALLGERTYTAQASGDLKAAHDYVEQIPLDVGYVFELATRIQQWLFEHDAARAVRELRQVLDSDPGLDPNDRPFLAVMLAGAEAQAGNAVDSRRHAVEAREATERLRAAGDANPYWFIGLTAASGMAGDAQVAERYAMEGEKALANDRLGLPQIRMAHAVAKLQAGDKSGAIALLEKAQSEPMAYGPFPAILRVDPRFDALRGDPAFGKLTIEPPRPVANALKL